MSVATTFVHDTFTDYDNSLLLLHRPDVGGPVKLLTGFAGSLTDPPTCSGVVSNLISYQIINNQACPAGTGGGASVGLYYDNTPSSADYSIYFTIVVPNSFSLIDSYHGVLFRTNPATGDHYRLVYYSYPAFKYWRIQKRVSGAESQVGTNVVQTLTAGATYKYKLTITGTTFTLNDVTSGSPGSQIGTWTDSSISAAGRVGLWANWSTSSIVFDEFRACNAGTNPEDYTLDLPVWPSRPRGIPGETSGPFTVTLQGSNAGPVTITPSVSGVAGTFSPTSLSLTGLNASGTFTFTPSGSATTPSVATISVSDNAALNDPAPVSYSVDYADLYGLPIWADSITNPVAGPVSATGPGYPTDPTIALITGNDQYQGLRDLYRRVQNYIGGSLFNRSIGVSRAAYNSTYIARSGGFIGQIVNYVYQNINEYYETGTAKSRDIAVLTRRWSNYSRYTDSQVASYLDGDSTQMRETAYCVLSGAICTRVGYANPASPVATVHRYCQALLTQLDDYMAGPGNRKTNNNTSQFYVGLAFQGLIAYWECFINDPGTSIPNSLNPGQTVLQLAQSIPAKIKQTIDWMMSPSRSQAVSNVANNGSGLYRLTVPSTANWTTGKKVLVLNTGVSAIDNKFWTVTVVDSTHLDLQGSTYAAGWTSGGQVNPLEWNPSTLSFAYRDDTPTDTPSGSVDYTTWVLNGDFIGGIAWYYQWTARVNGSRDPLYRDYTEKVFRGSYPVSLQGQNHGVCISNKEWSETHYFMPEAIAWVSRGDQAPAVATTLVVSPPTLSGAPMAWSGNFTVAISGGTAAAASGLPVAVTPSDGGAGGTFVPAKCNVSADFPSCVFRYRPPANVAGANVNISFSAPGLTGTNPVSYSVTSSPNGTATGITVDGPTSVAVGRWSLYTVSLSPSGSTLPSSLDAYGGSVSLYLNSSNSPNNSPSWIQLAGDSVPSAWTDGGRFLNLSSERPSQTFWFKPPSAGTWTLTAPSQEAVSWPSTGLTLTASGTPTFTAVNMYGPSSCFASRVSEFFNLVPNGSGNCTVTLSDGGAGGTFLPSSTITWSPSGVGYGGSYLPGDIASFVYLAPASTGMVSISATATGVTSPTPISLSVQSVSSSGGGGGSVSSANGFFPHAMYPLALFPQYLFPPVVASPPPGNGMFLHSLFPIRLFAGNMFCPTTYTPPSPHPPAVATPAACSPSTVTGSTASLSVLGSDDYGESTLSYTWSMTSGPAGATTPTYSSNGVNASKNSTVTFYKAGSYTLKATITNFYSLTVTSSVNVTVSQTTTSVSVYPSSTTVYVNSVIPYSATATDQFGDTVSPAPVFTWAKPTGTGSINSSTGVYTAPASPGSATISATANAVTGPASVTVISVPPATNLVPPMTGTSSSPFTASFPVGNLVFSTSEFFGGK